MEGGAAVLRHANLEQQRIVGGFGCGDAWSSFSLGYLEQKSGTVACSEVLLSIGDS